MPQVWNNERLEVMEFRGQRMVRLKYPNGPGGQIFRPDILADPDKFARYLNDWSIAWAHETALRAPDGHTSERPAFDAAKFRRLIDEDMHLLMRYEDLLRTGEYPDGVQAMEYLHRFVVCDDDALMSAYAAA